MKTATDWNVPKWPFLLGDALLLVGAAYWTWHAHHPIGAAEVAISAACVAFGAVLGILPFVMEYRATARLIEINGLETVADKIQRLDQVAAQISACTTDWSNAQVQAEKTAAGAREISERMSGEAARFSEFMQRMNDSEKSALRLEIEKLRRTEGDWLHVLVRILDHVFALHAAAENSDQPRVAAQIAQFQNACHDAARRVGLVPFGADADEPYNAERHQALGVKDSPAAGAVVADTVGWGFKYQGRIVRPALVRLQTAAPTKDAETPPQQLAWEPNE